MLTWLRELLWDKTAARAAIIFAITWAGAYVVQPVGRSEIERAVTALALAAGVSAASASGPRSQP